MTETALEEFPPPIRGVVEDFRLAETFENRMQLLIDYSEQFRPVSEQIAGRSPYPEVNKVPACESQVYLFTTQRLDKTLDFHFAVENPQGVSAKAMAAVLDQTLSGAPLAEVARLPEGLVYELFGDSISMGKGLGLMGMVQMVRAQAKTQLAQA